MKNLVILPTFNEAENIGTIIPMLLAYNSFNIDILVVDDNSPDHTSDIVRKLQQTHPQIHLIERERKLGLGSAYVLGFNYAVDNKYSDVIMMDSDLSHPTDKIGSLLASEADFAIGSRYIAGGGITGWPLFRRLLSSCANKFARFLLKLPVYDITAGFNRIRVDILKKLDYAGFKTEGYGFLIELKYNAWRKGCSFSEIPITFSERKNGKSKLGRSIILEAFWLVLRLSLKI